MDKYLEDLLRLILSSFLERPEACVITTNNSSRGVSLTLSVSTADMGIVIGRKGQMYQALRSILRSAGSKGGTIVNFSILEPTS